jgi:hypothetical protein
MFDEIKKPFIDKEYLKLDENGKSAFVKFVRNVIPEQRRKFELEWTADTGVPQEEWVKKKMGEFATELFPLWEELKFLAHADCESQRQANKLGFGHRGAISMATKLDSIHSYHSHGGNTRNAENQEKRRNVIEFSKTKWDQNQHLTTDAMVKLSADACNLSTDTAYDAILAAVKSGELKRPTKASRRGRPKKN